MVDGASRKKMSAAATAALRKKKVVGGDTARPAQTTTMCAAAHSYNAVAILQPICRRFGTEPEPTGSGPNQGSGKFGYYFGYLTTRVRVVNSGPGNPGTH